jgi:hypothetical protein
MATQLESVCTNPPVPTADKIAARCALCAKPLAEDNIYRTGGEAFCCKEAAQQHAVSNKRMDALNKKKGGFVGLLIKLIVIAAIAAGGWYGYQYLQKNPDAIKKGQQKLNEASEAAEDAIKKQQGTE